MKNNKFLPIIALAFVLVWAGCEKDYNYVMPKKSKPNTGEVTDTVHFKTVIEPIFANNGCAKSGCHLGSNLQLDLSTGNAHTSLFANGDISTADPENSILYIRVTLPSSDNEFMPEGGSPLSGTDIANILAWIEQGAKDN